MLSEPEEFTQLIQQADQGDTDAANRLYLLVQGQLRAIAKKRKENLRRGVDLSTTALVDEAFCDIVGQEITTWQTSSRKKFFRYVSTRMHGLLIDTARAEAARKRGGVCSAPVRILVNWALPKPMAGRT